MGNFAVGWNSGTTGSATLKVRVFTHNNDGTYTGGTIAECIEYDRFFRNPLAERQDWWRLYQHLYERLERLSPLHRG